MNKAELGQVFTSKLIADYMVSLLEIAHDSNILDPCFGGGAFLDALQRAGFANVTGCEIDRFWYDQALNRLNGVNLICGDFLRQNPDQLFDGIIMNPPYIRQERIDDLSEFGISKDILGSNPLYKVLPRKANLYMYFVLKALSLLKPNGQLVIIFPSSWLDAKVGISFKEYLYSEYNVEKQIHMHGEVFDGAAIVDVVILKVINQNSSNSTQVITLTAENGEIHQASSDSENMNLGFCIPFSQYASVRRGLTTGYNEAFINPFSTEDISEFLHPILSSPKDVFGYSTDGANFDSLLLISSETPISDGLKTYLSIFEQRITTEKRPKTLYEQIKQGNIWYTLNAFSGQGIIFSYFVRNEMKFVVHEGSAIIRDNFYVVFPREEMYLVFALLNNYYTYYQLEKNGKKYGAGLLKLQRYDIENLLFPDINCLQSDDRDLLINYAHQLAKTSDTKYIDMITAILEKTSNLTADEIRTAYFEAKKHRLENK